MGSNFWGTGLFIEAARAIVTFTFTSIGADRLEARSCVQNGRGNGALQKLGATREGVLRQSFLRNAEYHDQVLWAIVATDWRSGRPAERGLTDEQLAAFPATCRTFTSV